MRAQTFKIFAELLRNVDNSIILCIIGNKTDLQSDRMVKLEDAETYAMSINADYFETSALNHTGINEVFSCIANKLITVCDNKCSSFCFGDSFDLSQTKIDLNNSQKDKSSSCCK